MRSPNGSIHTTQTPPPLSFYNTFNVTYEQKEFDIFSSRDHTYKGVAVGGELRIHTLHGWNIHFCAELIQGRITHPACMK